MYLILSFFLPLSLANLIINDVNISKKEICLKELLMNDTSKHASVTNSNNLIYSNWSKVINIILFTEVGH